MRFGVEFTLFDLQRKLGVMLMFSATDHDAVVQELGRQVAEFNKGKITEVRSVSALLRKTGRGRNRQGKQGK